MATQPPETDQEDRLAETWTQKAMKYKWVVFPAIMLAWLMFLFVVGSYFSTW